MLARLWESGGLRGGIWWRQLSGPPPPYTLLLGSCQAKLFWAESTEDFLSIIWNSRCQHYCLIAKIAGLQGLQRPASVEGPWGILHPRGLPLRSTKNTRLCSTSINYTEIHMVVFEWCVCLNVLSRPSIITCFFFWHLICECQWWKKHSDQLFK